MSVTIDRKSVRDVGLAVLLAHIGRLQPAMDEAHMRAVAIWREGDFDRV